MKVIKVTPETLEHAKEELRYFLEHYVEIKENTGGHLTKLARDSFKYATEAEDVATFRKCLEFPKMELGILAQVFGLKFEF